MYFFVLSKKTALFEDIICKMHANCVFLSFINLLVFYRMFDKRSMQAWYCSQNVTRCFLCLKKHLPQSKRRNCYDLVCFVNEFFVEMPNQKNADAKFISIKLWIRSNGWGCRWRCCCRTFMCCQWTANIWHSTKCHFNIVYNCRRSLTLRKLVKNYFFARPQTKRHFFD